uniref:Uncharacterized protein n=1 Tax=Anguilla anguilla TaxID=7936 RepID=A0A0E9WMN5_ANGAN
MLYCIGINVRLFKYKKQWNSDIRGKNEKYHRLTEIEGFLVSCLICCLQC